LPCSTNGQDERHSADATIQGFCEYSSSTEHNLQKLFSGVRESFSEDYNWLGIDGSTKLAEGNIKARLRMMYLYNLASLTQGIVMDTDNLTEHYLGFWTIHGDVGDFNPIGGLWKHEVYELAKWLSNEFYNGTTDSRKIIAIRKAIVITPTDGNGVAVGGDMAQIAPGHTYNDVDDILMTYLTSIEMHTDAYQNAMYMLNEKYGAETVERVINRHVNSEFKRKRLPIAIERKEYQNFIEK
jgi:NAD+ synthetase